MKHYKELELVTDPTEETLLRDANGGANLPRAFTDGWNVYADAEELAAWRIARATGLPRQNKPKPVPKRHRPRWFSTTILK